MISLGRKWVLSTHLVLPQALFPGSHLQLGKHLLSSGSTKKEKERKGQTHAATKGDLLPVRPVLPREGLIWSGLSQPRGLG